MTISASDILSVTKKVTREWTRQRKAEERGRSSRWDRSSVYSGHVCFTDVADEILPRAYAHASGDGALSVPQRNFYYACREEFRKRTGEQLRWKYFSGKLLPQYMNRNHKTDSWKVTADPRGTLTIPNAAHDIRIPCGTIDIANHLSSTRSPIDHLSVEVNVPYQWPSLAGGQRIQAVVYIEKEGFGPTLADARTAERFDIAILSCKGQSVVAARQYVDHVCRVNGGVRLLIVHDFDKAGFEIAQRLTRVSDWARESDCVRYEFRNEVRSIDLGLRLADAQEYGLAEERVKFKGTFARDSICTDEEKEFLRSNRRIELNAFTAPQFIEWLERKLVEHGVAERTFIPDATVLEDAYRRALMIAKVNSAVEELVDDAREEAEAAAVPAGLPDQLAAAMQDSSVPWDAALYEIAKEET